ncbi:MAG TPA: polyisoprenoid-binding protein [Rhodospirillaceae bacterium]|nr:polyisoprenoid-binding protein [Rhodospirillaceae bacterium]
MKFKTAAILLAMTASVPALAETAGGPSVDLAKLEGGAFVLDKGHARLIFSFNHFGYSTSYGFFPSLEGKLKFDPKTVASSEVEVTVDLAGLDTTVPKLDEHMKSEGFFDVAKFPKAVFKSNKITVTGPTTGTISGDLTLHGVTKPVTLTASFNGGGINPVSKAYVLGFNATGHITRSEFGLGLYAPAVSDDVLLTISAEFDKAP